MAETFKIGKWLNREIFLKGLMSPVGKLFLVFLAIAVSYFTLKGDYLVVIAMIGALAGCIILYLCMFKPLTGFYLAMLMAAFAFYPSHIIHVELGISTLVEVLIWVILLGSLREKPPGELTNRLASSPVSIILIIYTVYHLIQFFNPDMGSLNRYFFIMRKFLMFLWIYIIAYRLLNTPEKVRDFIKFWIIIGFLAGLYGCYQQWFGYLPMELNFIMRDPQQYKLIFQGGQFRKFSFLSDVAQFGVFSGSMCVLTLIIGMNTKRKNHRNMLIFAAMIMALGMSYSGTRTTTVIIPVGISLYALMTIRNRATLFTVFGFIMIFMFILFAPINSNKTLNRMRTTFEADDPSLDVRNINRHNIQPYLYAHPFGGGLATTGNTGLEYSPNHPLAGFMPDSGLLQIGLEIGWLGLILTMTWYSLILYMYVYTAFRIRNQEFKIYTIAIACSLLGIIVTQYSQLSIGQIPMVIFFMASGSIVKRLLEFERLKLY